MLFLPPAAQRSGRRHPPRPDGRQGQQAHTHPLTHTNARILSPSLTHTHTQSLSHTQTHTCTHAHSLSRAHAHTSPHTHTHVHTTRAQHTHAPHTHTCTHAQTDRQTDRWPDTRVHANMTAHTLTHTHSHTHDPMPTCQPAAVTVGGARTRPYETCVCLGGELLLGGGEGGGIYSTALANKLAKTAKNCNSTTT